MADWRVIVKGYEAAQRANARAIQAVSAGNLGQAVQFATLEAERYSIGITHVITGTLRASERVRYDNANTRGYVYIDPTTVNPVERTRPVVYGPFEHARGGGHAFFERTVNEAGDTVLRQAGDMIKRGLP